MPRCRWLNVHYNPDENAKHTSSEPHHIFSGSRGVAIEYPCESDGADSQLSPPVLAGNTNQGSSWADKFDPLATVSAYRRLEILRLWYWERL